MVKRATSAIRQAVVEPSLELIVGVIVALAAAYFIMTGPLWNSDTHIFLTASMVDHGSVHIDAFARFTGDIAAAQGHYLADKAPGLSIAAIPFYWLFKMLVMHGNPLDMYLAHSTPGGDPPVMLLALRYYLAVMLSAVPTGIVAGLIMKMSRVIGAGTRWALLIGLTYGLGTIAHAFATQFFSHQLVAMLGFGAFCLIYFVRKEALPQHFLALAGALLGFAIITEYTLAVVAGVLGVYALVSTLDWRRTVRMFAAGAIPVLSLELVYNALAFGGPFALGYSNLAGPDVFKQGQAQGFFGITAPTWASVWDTTLGPYRGIFLLSPVLLLAIPAVNLMLKRSGWRAEALVCAVLGAAFLLINFSYFAYDGGFSMGPRHVLPAVPFMVLPLAELVRQGRHVIWRYATGGLALISMTLVMMSVAIRPLFDQRFKSPITQFVIPSWCGVEVRPEHPTMATPAQVVRACNSASPFFVSAKFGMNWGGVLDLPGLFQLFPLGILMMLVVIWYLHGRDVQLRRAESNVASKALEAAVSHTVSIAIS